MKTRQQSQGSRRAAFTLVEVAISALVLGLMMGVFGLVTATSNSAYRTTSTTTTLDVNGRRTLSRVASELASIGGSVLAPDPVGNLWTATLQYNKAADVDPATGAIVWGQDMQLGFEYATGEVDDGIDNDGNGLVDEGVVVLTVGVGGPNPQRVVICHDVREFANGEILNGADDNGDGLVDELGFSLQRLGDVMIVRLCLERRGSEDNTVVRTHQTSVRLRNIDL